MEHIGTLTETEDVLSPTIILLFGILSPPAEQKKKCHFCLEIITKGQVYGIQIADTSPTPNASKHGHLHPKKNPSYAAPIAEPPTHTKTPVSFAYKNTPKNSTAESAATQKSMRNAL